MGRRRPEGGRRCRLPLGSGDLGCLRRGSGGVLRGELSGAPVPPPAMPGDRVVGQSVTKGAATGDLLLVAIFGRRCLVPPADAMAGVFVGFVSVCVAFGARAVTSTRVL